MSRLAAAVVLAAIAAVGCGCDEGYTFRVTVIFDEAVIGAATAEDGTAAHSPYTSTTQLDALPPGGVFGVSLSFQPAGEEVPTTLQSVPRCGFFGYEETELEDDTYFVHSTDGGQFGDFSTQGFVRCDGTELGGDDT